jgi:hypothetical protein
MHNHTIHTGDNGFIQDPALHIVIKSMRIFANPLDRILSSMPFFRPVPHIKAPPLP